MIPYTFTPIGSVIDLTVGASTRLAQGLATGELVRYGSVIRHAAGSPRGGQIVAHLQELGLGPQMLGQMPKALERALQMSQIAAGASVLNLGVSAVGFAYTAHRLNQLQDSIDTMHRQLSGQLDGISNQIDAANRQLWYLRVLAEHDSAVLAVVRRDARHLARRSVVVPLAAVSAIATDARRFGVDADRQVLRQLDAAFMQLGDILISLEPEIDPATLLNLDMANQGWLAAAAMQAALLDGLGRSSEASDLLSHADQLMASVAQRWAAELLKTENRRLANPYRFATPTFNSAVTAERIARIASISPAIPDPENAALEARVEMRMTTTTLDQTWIAQQVAVAGILDQLAESAHRLSARHAFAVDCHERGTNPTAVVAQVQMVAREQSSGLFLIEAA